MKLDIVNHFPSFIKDIQKNGKLTKKNSTPHDQELINVKTVASPAVPPKVRLCKAKNFNPSAVKNKPTMTRETILKRSAIFSPPFILLHSLPYAKKQEWSMYKGEFLFI